MNEPSDFDLLMSRVIDGEATAEESARFAKLISENPALRTEFEATQEADSHCRSLFDSSYDEKAKSAMKSLREERLDFIREDQRRHKIVRFRRVIITSAAAVILIGLGFFLLPGREPGGLPGLVDADAYVVPSQGTVTVERDGKKYRIEASAPSGGLIAGDLLTLEKGARCLLVTGEAPRLLEGPVTTTVERSGSPSTTADLAGVVTGNLDALLALDRFQVNQSAAPESAITILSPLKRTGTRVPLVLWRGDPEHRFTVTLEATKKALPVEEFRDVESPLRISKPLEPNTTYKITIEDQTSGAREEKLFLTGTLAEPFPSAESRAEATAHAVEALSGAPPSASDALAHLSLIPASSQPDLLVLRLKLLLFSELELWNELERVRSELEELARKAAR